MSNLNLFIDPKTKQSLYYDLDKQTLSPQGGKGRSYNVINGIPRFVSKSLYQENCQPTTDETRTGLSFGSLWQDPKNKNYGYKKYDLKALENRMLLMLNCNNKAELQKLFKKSKRILNGGCGIAWSEYLFDLNPEAERHCIDLSLAIEVARKNTAHMPNVTISQASVLEIPYPDGIFDLIFSFGVVHHTQDAKSAVLELCRKVAKGGIIGIYIYNIKPFIRELCDKHIRETTTKMSYKNCMEFSKKMTLLGKALSKITQPLILEEDIELLGIKAGEYNVHRFVYEYIIKCWYNSNQSDDFADIANVDWYHPLYASHHSKEEVLGWFKEAGFNEITCRQPDDWKSSGYFISAFKP